MNLANEWEDSMTQICLNEREGNLSHDKKECLGFSNESWSWVQTFTDLNTRFTEWTRNESLNWLKKRVTDWTLSHMMKKEWLLSSWKRITDSNTWAGKRNTERNHWFAQFITNIDLLNEWEGKELLILQIWEKQTLVMTRKIYWFDQQAGE